MMEFTLKMRNARLILTLIVSVGALIAAGISYVSHLEGNFGECEVAVRKSIPSPDESKAIIIFDMECGATVGFNTQASIAPAQGLFSPSKNPPFFAISGADNVVATWLEDHTIQVVIPDGAKVFKREHSVGDVEVKYIP
jgi:hypothetical protein